MKNNFCNCDTPIVVYGPNSVLCKGCGKPPNPYKKGERFLNQTPKPLTPSPPLPNHQTQPTPKTPSQAAQNNLTSCPINCDQSDYYPGGKCDQNGCYQKPELKDQIPPLQAIANDPETSPNFRKVATTLIEVINEFEKLKA